MYYTWQTRRRRPHCRTENRVSTPRGYLEIPSTTEGHRSQHPLAPQDLTEDSICANVTQHIFILYTPSERNARGSTTVHQLHLRDTLYGFAVYPAPPDDTYKGVIRSIDLDHNQLEN
ncbi:hypothetical protein HPB52_000198 [Rhipicephalus sanguineus]|uniref:Uncharacterized protein n=1 Tax=Rhipicephalus sanguineus TaxID=34632 RepID=A0A9D4PI79_RHISA|nr:hypothetical protein HPB52_000198 [Rhipicephalus sanguineus]